uniref:GG15214 n=2 Tax=Drosophila erecta TaxID=7220 RepID=B3P337_DROER
MERRLAQKQARIGSRNYPIEYVLLPSARGGYRRRYIHSLAKAAPTTTERPLVRVWNSFVRSVQPAFSFRNLTNPLANFFNDGSANIIETSPVYLQSYDDEQELQLEEPAQVAPQTSSKRKRKRRKQQKRRPVYDSGEHDDDYSPYDPYFAPPSPPRSAEPIFFYDTNSGSYYGVQRFSPQDFHTNFYGNFNIPPREAEVESDPERDAPVTRRLGTRKVTLLRPLSLLSAKDQSSTNLEVSKPEPSNENVETAEETDISAPISDDDDGDTEDHSPLSESMRNTLGTYMRDDSHTRQRQRLASDAAGDFDSAAKVSPRHQQRHLARLSAW